MMKKILAALIGALFAQPAQGVSRGRAVTHDSAMAFPFRMGSGFAGDVNRTHPASVEPCLIDEDAPPTLYGEAVLVDATTHGVRPFAAGDTAVDTIWGATVRPFPTQQTSGGMSSDFGSATPPVTGVIDVLRSGYLIINLAAATGAAKKGSAVFVWCAASSGDHIQGGFEDAADSGNTAALDPEKYSFNNSPDADGNVEICVNV